MSNQCRILLFSVLILCCADLQDNLVQAKRLEHATAAKGTEYMFIYIIKLRPSTQKFSRLLVQC